MENNKLKVFVLQYGNTEYKSTDHTNIIDELQGIFSDSESEEWIGEEFKVKVILMDEEEFFNLPEFDGF